MDFTLSFISFAALLVKVTARTDPALTPVYIRYAVLIVMALVFPEPAPARIRSGPSVCSTASFCLGLRRAISLDISIDIYISFQTLTPKTRGAGILCLMITAQMCPYKSSLFIAYRAVEMFYDRIKVRSFDRQEKFLDLQALSGIDKTIHINITTVQDQMFHVGCYGGRREITQYGDVFKGHPSLEKLICLCACFTLFLLLRKNRTAGVP